MRRLVCLLFLALVLLPRGAVAHEVGLSQGEYRRHGKVLEVELVLAQREAASLVGGLDADESGSIDDHELARSRAGLERLLLGDITVAANAGACVPQLTRAATTQRDGLLVAGQLQCARALDESWQVTVGFVGKLARGHRHAARIIQGSSSREQLVYGERPAFEVPSDGALAGDTPVLRRGVGFLSLGLEHILGGFDHLLFLFALVLAGGRLRSLIGIISAFTVGHSLSLALATFGVWAPSPSFIEPGIALSIAYVAIENLLGLDPSKRWRITLPFGLVHGFGFSGALLDVGLPRSELPSALFFFNAGVEVGQVALLCVALPLVVMLRDWQRLPRHALPVLNAVLVGVAAFWFCQRVLA